MTLPCKNFGFEAKVLDLFCNGFRLYFLRVIMNGKNPGTIINGCLIHTIHREQNVFHILGTTGTNNILDKKTNYSIFFSQPNPLKC